MTKTTITVDEKTHSDVLKMQSILTLMSGSKCSLSETVSYSVNATMNTTLFATTPFAVSNYTSSSNCTTEPQAQWTTTSSTRFSLREEK